MTPSTHKLFEPFPLGDLKLSNRIVMAPLTRNRAEHGSNAPVDLNGTYYEQRASAGLIISEASQISQQGQGYAWTPGIYTEAQVQGWKRVTDRVHAAHGHIFLQLWHVGRVSHTSLQLNGGAPVAPSAIRAQGKTFTETGFVDVSTPRALEVDELPGLLADFTLAAQNAKKAGFDGVEIHAANGYLIDQFLKDGSNHRTDTYGVRWKTGLASGWTLSMPFSRSSQKRALASGFPRSVRPMMPSRAIPLKSSDILLPSSRGETLPIYM